MLKFFRQIRRKLLDEGSLRKYLIYAFGEILLVMIGILLALQVNTWNDVRKERKKELSTLKELMSDFSSNKVLFHQTITIKRAARNGWKRFLLNLANDNFDAIEQNVFGSWNLASRTTNLNSGTLQSIMASGRIDNIENDSLKNLLLSWENIFDEYKEEELYHRDFDLNQLRPYERSLYPIPRFSYPEEGDSFLYRSLSTDTAFKKAYRKALMDIEYRNLLMMNHSLLSLQVDEGLIVEQTIDQIIRLLQEEIKAKSK